MAVDQKSIDNFQAKSHLGLTTFLNLEEKQIYSTK